MNEMNITSAQYLPNEIDKALGLETIRNRGIQATIDGVEMSVPLCEGNRHYDEIMRQVEAGTLTIQEAD